MLSESSNELDIDKLDIDGIDKLFISIKNDEKDIFEQGEIG